MFSDHDKIYDPVMEDCLSEYSYLVQLSDLSIDCRVPVSPLNSLFMFDLLCSWFDYEVVFYDFPVYSHHVGRSLSEDVLVFL